MMTARGDEEDRLRTVALQNAQSILRTRVQADESLRKQSEWLRVTLASIGDAVISTDAEGRVTFLNGVAEALTGWTQAEAVGRPLPDVFRIVNGRTREPAENPALRALREGTVVGLANHTILIARDGTERPIDDSAAPMRDESGAPIGAVLVFRDVTERKRAEEDRARLAAIVESSEDAIVGKTLDGVIRSWNAGAERVFGYTADEAVGRSITLIIPPERLDEERVILARLCRGERVEHFETVRVAKDGRRLVISLTVSPIRDDEGRVIGASKIARDITEAKRAEDALRESEARYRAIVEATPECVKLIGRDGTLLQMNAAGLAMVEAAEADALGRCIYDVIAPEDRAAYRAFNERVCRGVGGSLEFDIVGLKGTRRHMETTAVPLADPTGGFTHLGVARDVTARRREAAFLEGQKQVLEQIARGGALPDVLASLCRLVEERSGDEVLASILLAESGRLRHGAAPSLPDPYNRAIDGIPIGPAVGSCGTAAFRRAPVYVADIATDPLWDAYRGLALGHGLRACWAEPILAGDGELIGTFAMYYRTPRGPEPADLRLVDLVTRTAGLAVERTRAAEAQRRLLAEVDAERGRLAEVFRRAPSFLAVLRGPEHVFELANDRYYQLIGDRDIIGKSVREALPEVEGQGFFELLDGVYRTGEAFVGTDMRLMVRRDPGRPPEERFVEFVFQPLRGADDSVSGIIAQGVDLTDRKRAQEGLARVTAESERRRRLYETILSSTPDFVYVFSLDHRVLYANDSLLAMWGRRWEDAIGRTFLEVGYEPWHAEMHGREIDEVRATKRPVRGEAPFAGTHGRRIYDYIFVPVLGADGEVEAVAGTTRDVTDRKEADRRKDEFIALLAHELRNPLAPLRNGLQVMRLAGGDAEAVAQARAMMERQLGHMVRLIDDLLDVSRIGQHKMELRRSRVLLTDVINGAVETARPMIEEAGHELIVALPAEPVPLDADLTRLAQVFSNLLTNSAKYTERGGRIRLDAERRGGEVVVTVKDNGIGIPAEALPRIFDMFSQVDRSIERSTGGLGIGLALVKGLVEMQGGTVAAESEGQDKGSTFTVRLPVLDTIHEPADAAGPEDGRPAGGPKRRILVVDDNRDSARSMARLLKLMGDETRAAHDGLEAVEVADEFRPEVILMDMGMPRLNGYEATRRIRERDWGRSAIIIALTGWGQEGDRVQSREAGCDGHLVKPVNYHDLEKLLAELTGAPGHEHETGSQTNERAQAASSPDRGGSGSCS